MNVPPLAKTNIDIVAAIRANSRAISDGLIALGNTNTASNAALEKKFDLLLVELALLTKRIGGDSEPISLDNVNESCIKDAFTFMRTLNEIESLTTDSDFNLEENNQQLKSWTQKTKKGVFNALYRNCVEILEKFDKEQPIKQESDQLKSAFDKLFTEFTGNPDNRAERLMEIHQFRDRILRFFYEQCPNEQPETSNVEPATNPTVTTSIALVKGDAASSQKPSATPNP